METVFRGVGIYLILLVVIRMSGRRTLSQMTAFDFVLLLIIAETTQQALLGDDFSMANATVLILTLFATDILLSLFKGWMPRAAHLLDGVPTVLISLGKPDEYAMRRSRVDIEEILEAARSQHGIERLDQIKSAVLEVGGHVSIVPAEQKK